MLNYDKLIFSSSAYNILSLDCKSKRLSHAYLFVSKDENLLKRFSECVAKLFINLESKGNEEKNNLRIDRGVHPDVKFFGEDKNIDSALTAEIVERFQKGIVLAGGGALIKNLDFNNTSPKEKFIFPPSDKDKTEISYFPFKEL